jgi:FAD/FMN-containing dehydrogenase
MVLRDRGLALGSEVMLDRSGFDRLARVEEQSMTIEAGAGVSIREVEARANAHRLSLGPLPPAAWSLSVGELIEDPGQAFRVVVPGRLECLASRVQGVLPDGHLVTSPPGPRHATGPDLATLLIGSGGRVGLVTSATLRLTPLPDVEHRLLFSFDTHVSAIESLRDALSAGVVVARAVVRGRAGRSLVEITVRGNRTSVECGLDLFSRCAERAAGRFEGQGRELEVDGAEAEVSWPAIARALSVGMSVELFRVSLASVMARGVPRAALEPPSPLTLSLSAAFDRTGALGSWP